VTLPRSSTDRDLAALARELGADLDSALAGLAAFYAALDARISATIAGLDLPCARGCADCCHESVFLTPLEFLFAWDHAQRHLDPEVLSDAIARGLAIYHEQTALFLALEEPPPSGYADHLPVARELRFRCPLLGADGACGIYPARELFARLFGCSFNEESGIYGCHLVGEHLAGREVTLIRARVAARQLTELPLTFMRRPYPYYLQLLYG
jgi:hypothetical protein